MPVEFTFTFADAAAAEEEEEDDDDEEEEEEEEDDVSLVVDADTPFSTTAPPPLPTPALQGTLACMYKAGFDVYDINPQRAMDVSQRSRTCLDFMMSCGSATSMTAENASRSLLKSVAAGRVRSVLETAAPAVVAGTVALVTVVVVAVVEAVVVAGRTELKTLSVARVAVPGTATADSDDVITIDSSDVEVSADDVTATVTGTETGTGEGALYLQNPAAFALAERMFRSCFSVYGWTPRAVHASNLKGTSTTVAIILIRGWDNCN